MVSGGSTRKEPTFTPVLSPQFEKLLNENFTHYQEKTGLIDSVQALKQLCMNLIMRLKVDVPEPRETVQRLVEGTGLGPTKGWRFDHFALFWCRDFMDKFKARTDESDDSEMEDLPQRDWWSEYSWRISLPGVNDSAVLELIRRKNKEGEAALDKLRGNMASGKSELEAQDVAILNTAHRVNIHDPEIAEALEANKHITEALCAEAARVQKQKQQQKGGLEDELLSLIHI
eukprot:TRINITY_DN16900_c0_g1_i3.p1 TRINITY_DN16900_c0_g1~~TRINITY_DN16900_c0_g1_i3.p1  ORF type:complete len:230 (-),score=75.08 TRINITY_DN16900_c0_g1_i3:180-869(-)